MLNRCAEAGGDGSKLEGLKLRSKVLVDGIFVFGGDRLKSNGLLGGFDH
jgi:hypothetical protein